MIPETTIRPRAVTRTIVALVLAAASCSCQPTSALADNMAVASPATTVIAIAEAEPDTPDEVEPVAHVGDKWVFELESAGEADALAKALDMQQDVAAATDDLVLEAAEGGDAKDAVTSDADAAISAISQNVPSYAGRHVVALIDSGVADGTAGVLSRWTVLADRGVDDACGHGTAMAASMHDAWAGAEIVSIRALGANGSGTVSSIVAAMDLAIEMDADVISLSVAGSATEENSVLAAEVDKATEAGVLVVCAAGNAGANASGYVPANTQAALVVGACDAAGMRLPSSNWGDTVDFYVEAGSTSEAAARMSALVAKCIAAGNGPMGIIGEQGVHVPAESAETDGATASADAGDGLLYAQAYSFQKAGLGSHDVDFAVINPNDFDLDEATKNGGLTNTSAAKAAWYSTGLNTPTMSTNYRLDFYVGKTNQWTGTAGALTLTWPNRALGSDGKSYDVRVTISNVSVYAAATTGTKQFFIISNNTTDGSAANSLWIGGGFSAGTTSSGQIYGNNAIRMNVKLQLLEHGTSTPASGSMALYFGDVDALGWGGVYSKDRACEQWSFAQTGAGRLSDFYLTSTTKLGVDATTVWAQSNNTNANDTNYGFLVLGQAGGSTLTFTSAIGWSRLFNAPSTSKLHINPNGGTVAGSTATYTPSANLVYNSGNHWSVAVATRSGHTLLGYYSSAAGGTQVYDASGHAVKCQYWSASGSSAKYIGIGDLTVYAHWQPNTYAVSYDANGGSGAPASQTKTHDVALTLSSTRPTRSGYTFKGWSTSRTSTSATYQPGGSYTDNAPITLYAVWSKDTYAISYDLRGGTVRGNPTTYQVDTATFNLRNPTRAGYVFTGWTGTGLGAASTTVTIPKGSTGNRGYTAAWTPIVWYVKFDGNGATSGSMQNETMTYDVPAALTTNAYKRTGHTFTGWNTRADGSGTSYADGQSVQNLTTASGATVTLYAQWKVHTYTIAFDGNRATSGSTPSMSMTYGDSRNLTTNGFARTGYVFVGWNSKADGTGTSYADSQKVRDLTETDGDTVTLYAQWKANQVVVTIPTKIAYDGMDAGRVSTSDSYAVTVGGSFSGEVTVTSFPSPLVNAAGDTLSAESASNTTPLVFSANGSKTDTVTMTGTAGSASVFEGSVAYEVDFEHPAN